MWVGVEGLPGKWDMEGEGGEEGAEGEIVDKFVHGPDQSIIEGRRVEERVKFWCSFVDKPVVRFLCLNFTYTLTHSQTHAHIHTHK